MQPAEQEKVVGLIQYWMERYGLHEWKVALVEKPVEHPEIMTEANYLRATLAFPESFDYDRDLNEIIRHEIGHVFLAELAFFAGRMLDTATKSQQYPLNQQWHYVWERTTERLSRLMSVLEEAQLAGNTTKTP